MVNDSTFCFHVYIIVLFQFFSQSSNIGIEEQVVCGSPQISSCVSSCAARFRVSFKQPFVGILVLPR